MSDKDEKTAHADGKWEFNEGVTDCFDDMLQRSIPQYEVMRKACVQLGFKYVQHRTNIVDLGASKGEAVFEFYARYKDLLKYVLIEISPPMVQALFKRFSVEVTNKTVSVLSHDLRKGLPSECYPASVVLSVLTLQFTPIEHRQKIIQDIYNSLVPGGAFILVEKVLGNTAAIDNQMTDIYYDLKKDHGYSQEQIERKRLSLEGVLVPIAAKWNEDLLKSAGFKEVDCFWRWMNFAGWLAVK